MNQAYGFIETQFSEFEPEHVKSAPYSIVCLGHPINLASKALCCHYHYLIDRALLHSTYLTGLSCLSFLFLFFCHALALVSRYRLARFPDSFCCWALYYIINLSGPKRLLGAEYWNAPAENRLKSYHVNSTSAIEASSSSISTIHASIKRIA